MTPTRMRLMGAAAALSAIAIAAPVSAAGASTVVGPTFVASAGATFINFNTQVSDSPISAGNQIAP